eukprot:TRINITY_DN557_c0_g1_i10.p1 TRINITY_DN557_c0_g1~~TRINITY_DN557_c0_g1_i10.p1  ORF type:complete len:217 (+),score=69.39 TRINITY_DN557_c0_g1_i10:211-861(+)
MRSVKPQVIAHSDSKRLTQNQHSQKPIKIQAPKGPKVIHVRSKQAIGDNATKPRLTITKKAYKKTAPISPATETFFSQKPPHAVNELDAEVNISQNSYQTTVSYASVDRKNEYLRILAYSNAFRDDEDKSAYLLKELENAMIKIEMLEMDFKALKRDNKNWRSIVKANYERKDSEQEEEAARLREQIAQLKNVIAEQNLQLEVFKKEVIEKYCRKD